MAEENNSLFEGFDPAQFVKKEKEQQKVEDWRKFRLEQQVKAETKAKVEKAKPKKPISKKARKRKAFLTKQRKAKFEKFRRGVIKLRPKARKVRPKRLSPGEIAELRSLGIVPSPSEDNRHMARLNQMERKADRYEKALADGQVPYDYFLRKQAIKKRKLQAMRDFARRNNLLAKQHEMPKEDFNILDVDSENNILKSENIMRKKEDSINILSPRRSILATRQHGNDLSFW